MSRPSFSADWPPTLDENNPTVRALDGRIIERYIHGPRQSWGYPSAVDDEWGRPPERETGATEQNHNSFYVVFPKKPRDNAPLYVVLHSANRTAYDYLGYGLLNRKIGEADDPSTAMTNPPDDFYALYLNSTNAEWWGWTEAQTNIAGHTDPLPPAERRVLDTIDWVVTRFKIDRNRIYLSGVSMGGNGALGIGITHGDVFAAIRVTVPAGTGFGSYSMGGFAPSPPINASKAERAAWILKASGAGYPDPPVIVDFSSPQDTWSVTQPALLQAAQAGHLPLVLSWGPFGHTAFGSRIARSSSCQVAMEYPWIQIRKDLAYPVFTHASSDQRSPWLNAPVELDESGQMNAYFRWENLQDTASAESMLLWIAHPAVKNPPATMPDSAVADVTLRRMEQFKVHPGRDYRWRLSRAGEILASGTVAPDEAGLLTIREVQLTLTPTELTVEAGSTVR
jgi:poly(3-hydroxybutyrate) depolymerase